MFDWEWAQTLAQEFRAPAEWIERGIRACREADVDPEYFIVRYLHHKLPEERKQFPMDQTVGQVLGEILDDVYRQPRPMTSSLTT